MSRRNLAIASAVAITALCLWWALHNVELSELGHVLSVVRWRWLVPLVLIVGILDISIRAWRWRILLSQAVQAPVGDMFRLSAIGLAVNNLLFARLGELLRAVLAARKLKLSLATTLASIVVERTLDLAALLTLFDVAAFMLPGLVPTYVHKGGLLALLAVATGLVFLILAEQTLAPGGWVERNLRSWPKLHKIVEDLALGAVVLRRPRALLPVVGLSLGLWAVDAAVFWLGAFALGLERFIDYPRSILVLAWAGVGSSIPAVPGAIGTFEAMVKGIVVEMGVAPQEAFAYALFLHMLCYLIVTGIGLVFLYREGLSLGGIRESLEKAGKRVL